MRRRRAGQLWFPLLLAAVAADYLLENHYLRLHPLATLELRREVLHFNRSLSSDLLEPELFLSDSLWLAAFPALLVALCVVELYRRRR